MITSAVLAGVAAASKGQGYGFALTSGKGFIVITG
jgi:hypothetical protein